MALVVAVAVLGLGACGEDDLAPGEARLVVDGRTELAPAGHGFRAVHASRLLARGDRVRVRSGSARIEFSGRRRMELRREAQVLYRGIPQLISGHALASAEDGRLTVAMEAANAEVVGGATHLVQSLTSVAAAYTGAVELESAGRRLHIPALRQAAVATPGLVPDRAVPLAYDAGDAWDRRYLGDAMELGNDLVSRSRGFTAQLAANEGRTAGFYRQLLPALESAPEFTDASLDPQRSPGETLVGVAIVAEGKKAVFAERYAAVFTFRDEGASWGLVAADQAVTRAPLLRDLDLAIGRAFTPFAPPRGGRQERIVQPNGLSQPPAPATGPANSPTTPTTRRRGGTPGTSTTLPGGVTIPSVTIPNP